MNLLISIGFTLEWILFVVSGVTLAQGNYLSAFVIFLLALGLSLGVGKAIENEAVKKYLEEEK